MQEKTRACFSDSFNLSRSASQASGQDQLEEFVVCLTDDAHDDEQDQEKHRTSPQKGCDNRNLDLARFDQGDLLEEARHGETDEKYGADQPGQAAARHLEEGDAGDGKDAHELVGGDGTRRPRAGPSAGRHGAQA